MVLTNVFFFFLNENNQINRSDVIQYRFVLEEGDGGRRRDSGGSTGKHF